VPTLERIIGVYHADGGIVGELRYVVGKLRGSAHCSLCDITHGPFAPKSAWKECAVRWGVPVVLVHLNERSAGLRDLTEGTTPCVVAELDDGSKVVVLRPEDLDACKGSVDAFTDALQAALDREGIVSAQ
jgi:hypothetical protein